jgi:hypothetical protein
LDRGAVFTAPAGMLRPWSRKPSGMGGLLEGDKTLVLEWFIRDALAPRRSELSHAEGPLSYSHENPPPSDYYFQYGWVVPGIFSGATNKRRHLSCELISSQRLGVS